MNLRKINIHTIILVIKIYSRIPSVSFDNNLHYYVDFSIQVYVYMQMFLTTITG